MCKPIRDFALEVHFAKWQFSARYNLSGSDAESWNLPERLAIASAEGRAKFEAVGFGYTETWCAPKLREAIAATYDKISRAAHDVRRSRGGDLHRQSGATRGSPPRHCGDAQLSGRRKRPAVDLRGHGRYAGQ